MSKVLKFNEYMEMWRNGEMPQPGQDVVVCLRRLYDIEEVTAAVTWYCMVEQHRGYKPDILGAMLECGHNYASKGNFILNYPECWQRLCEIVQATPKDVTDYLEQWGDYIRPIAKRKAQPKQLPENREKSVKAQLKKNPELSNRQIAKLCSTSHTYVNGIRRQMAQKVES